MDGGLLSSLLLTNGASNYGASTAFRLKMISFPDLLHDYIVLVRFIDPLRVSQTRNAKIISIFLYHRKKC